MHSSRMTTTVERAVDLPRDDPEAYIARDRRWALSNHRDMPDRVEGSALFADISGFTPLTEFTVQDVMRVESAAGSGFSGTLHNGLDASVDEPAVTVFALDAVGRPLATTDVTRAEPLLSGEDWEFLTPPVIDAGQNEVAYALGDVKF